MSRSGKPGSSARRPSPLPPPDRKAAQVQDMFNRIARRYDRMNRLMTVGRDRAWRRFTVAQIASPSAAPRPSRLLDLATGTGDLALEALRQEPSFQVVGVDFSPSMLALARKKAGDAASTRLSLAAGDALRLPFPDGTFDAAVTGFAMRNVASIPQALAEMARVTRPGGRLACLEIAKPRLPIFRRLFAFYFYRLVPLLGTVITGERAAYTYLPHSLTAFLTPDELAGVMRRTGWRDVGYKRLMLGTVAVHVGIRE